MDTRDKKVLYLVQHMYGGTVKQISNAKAFKYKLRNRKGLISLINDVNGLIRNPVRKFSNINIKIIPFFNKYSIF